MKSTKPANIDKASSIWQPVETIAPKCLLLASVNGFSRPMMKSPGKLSDTAEKPPAKSALKAVCEDSFVISQTL